MRVLQKLLRYSNGTIVSILFISRSLSVWPVIFILKLNESVALAPLKSIKLPILFTVGISLQYYHKLPDVFEQLSIFLLSLYIGITILIYSALPIWVLFILLMQLVNEEQFLNINFLHQHHQ